ncbi:MAG: hypothetical protein IPH46_17315 [Bacteroidetes bacterium]|nr:hypothetical protein [Bacteroidota bacterium]
MQTFIDRFSANASKSRQATSRRKMLEKINLEDIKPSSRRYPGIIYKMAREAGKEILSVRGLNYASNGETLIKDLTFTINHNDKITFISRNSLATTALHQILAGDIQPDSGTIEWGQTITRSYLPNENSKFFMQEPMNLIDWLRQYSPEKTKPTSVVFSAKCFFPEKKPSRCPMFCPVEKRYGV